MSTSAEAVRFEDASMVVDLTDGRTLSMPLAWFPRLMAATPEQLRQVRISRKGLHWEELDEDVSVASLLAGRGGRTGRPDGAAGRGGPSRPLSSAKARGRSALHGHPVRQVEEGLWRSPTRS